MPETTTLTPLLATIDETCRLLGGISRETVRKMRLSGELPTVPIGDRPMIAVEDIQAWIRANKTAPQVTPLALAISGITGESSACSGRSSTKGAA